MDTNKKTARIAGVLLIFAMITGILGAIILNSILSTPDYLTGISENENLFLIGVLLQFVMALACAGIAIALYPVLKKYNEGLAIGSVSFRIIEGVLYIIGAISLFSLLTLSQEFIKGETPDASYFQTLGTLILAVRDWVGFVLGAAAFSLGAFMYYYIFYQTRLIPRWLSAWGIIGVIILTVSSMLVMFNIIGPMSVTQNILAVPIALQEIVFAAWLIMKGFNLSTIEENN